MKRHRVVLIGCGNIALAGHIPALLAHPRFDLVALCDVRPERLDLARKACGRDLPSETNYQSLITNHHPVACILALHPEHSVNIAIDLLQRGISVLDEKPLAATLEDGTRLAKAVRASKAPYQVGFVFRYCPLLRDVAEWTRGFGSPRLYQVAIYDERPSQHLTDGQAMIQNLLRRSSAITHEGSHIVDWMGLLNPSPLRTVKASAIQTSPEFAGPNFWLAQFQYADGTVLDLTIGWLVEDLPPCSMRILGRGGLLDLELFRGTGHLAIGGSAKPIQTQPYAQAWASQLDRFAEAVDTGRVTGATIADGLRALHATIACERSWMQRRTIGLKEGLLT
jgi:predicted dehydrogenase